MLNVLLNNRSPDLRLAEGPIPPSCKKLLIVNKNIRTSYKSTDDSASNQDGTLYVTGNGDHGYNVEVCDLKATQQIKNNSQKNKKINIKNDATKNKNIQQKFEHNTTNMIGSANNNNNNNEKLSKNIKKTTDKPKYKLNNNKHHKKDKKTI